MKITRKDLRRLISEAMTDRAPNNVSLKNLNLELAIAMINTDIDDISFDLGEYTREYRVSIRNKLEQLIELCVSGDTDDIIIGKLYMIKQKAAANGDVYIHDAIERIFDDCTEIG